MLRFAAALLLVTFSAHAEEHGIAEQSALTAYAQLGLSLDLYRAEQRARIEWWTECAKSKGCLEWLLSGVTRGQ